MKFHRLFMTGLFVMTPLSLAIADEDGSDVPHIVVLDNAGAIELEFEVVPAVDPGDGIPTVTVFTSMFNALAGEYTSQPVSGLTSGFVNDDNGFESEAPLLGSNITVTLSAVEAGADPFFVSLGAQVLTGASVGSGFALGDTFDDHPIFGLLSNDPQFTGSASLLFDITDANGALSGTETIRVVVSADPADAIPALLLGDANNDLQVTGADLIAVQQNFGDTGAADGLLPGDANDDGQVTGADLIAVQQNFGDTVAAPNVSQAPEPTAIVLLGSASWLLIRRGMRSQ